MTVIDKVYTNESTLISFRKKDKAKKIIRRNTLLATGLGFLPVPILDTISITSIQILMIKELAKVYEVSFEKQRVKSFVSILLGNMGTLGLFKVIPILGSFLGGGVVSLSAGAITYALGSVFMGHFNQGGNLLDFDPITSRAYFLEIYNKKKEVEQELINLDESKIIQQLKKDQKRLLEEEGIHTTLHEEAEQLVIELKDIMRTQEHQSFVQLYEKTETILTLEKDNYELKNRIDTLKKELEKKKTS